MRTRLAAIATFLVLAAGSPIQAEWARDADGNCREHWSASSLARGPIAMVNAPLAPVRSGMGAVHWLLHEDQVKRSTTSRAILAPTLALVGGVAGLIDTGVWLVAGLGDTLTGGALALAPDEAAARVSFDRMRPFFVPANTVPPFDPCAGE